MAISLGVWTPWLKRSFKRSWSTCQLVAGESSKEAFLRRLKNSDPAYDIFASYAEEHGERWANAKALSMDEAVAQMPGIWRCVLCSEVWLCRLCVYVSVYYDIYNI